LGLLVERRGYGYELVQRLIRRLGTAWQLNPSAVYTALDQLEDAALIRRTGAAAGKAPQRPSRRAERVIYEATPLGVQEFEQWLARPSMRLDPIRSEIQLKVALAGPDNVPPLLASIAQEEWIVKRMHQECLIAAGQGGVARRDMRKAADEAWPITASALVNAAAIQQLEGQLAWIESVRETLQRLTAEDLGVQGGRSSAAGA
jgi:DNA-binding PadR family transcriptional regulator